MDENLPPGVRFSTGKSGIIRRKCQARGGFTIPNQA